ncbi:mannose-6-phosphate isomerase [Vibrio maritimus]|uniref:mannose-6-phosphate isomerase n=1 Tax=Vibrio maritimus TaxID=990268 RepID=A0A090TC88_9VIBR|nr:mannose-6-phosphate isomerase [Vibrio maritimus]
MLTMNINSTQVFYPMSNVIQHFAWGSVSSLNQLFGVENSKGEPQAEMWMGAHPNGCSSVRVRDDDILLSDLINVDRDKYLSEETSQKFGELPYLFKILAAEKALSIQVHPSKVEAEEGYKREELAGIPLNAAHRNFKDPNHKPELVYALTSYQAMNGFRSSTEIVSFFSLLDIELVKNAVDNYKKYDTPAALREFFVGLLSLSGGDKAKALEVLLSFASENKDQPVFSLILELSEQYPGDIGLFSPLFLNVITLQPGEAMFLDARTPHAYLKGTALEVMANSDNVLRAGLTSKYIDVEELAKCTLFQEKPRSSLLLEPKTEDGVSTYPIPVPDFKFSIYASPSTQLVYPNSAEILLSLDCDATLTHKSGQSLTLKKGQSVFVPAFVDEYTLNAKGRVAKAYC